MVKTKAVKVPVELIDCIKENEGNLTPGDVLQNAYHEFVKLKALADVLSDMDGGGTGRSVSEIIIVHIKGESSKYEKFDKSLIELSTMVEGLSIFFKKYGR